MTVKFFAYLREYTNCKIVDFPYQEDVRKLTQALSETYGNRLREKLLTPDGTDLGEEIIILVNGRHVEHLGGIDTSCFRRIQYLYSLWWLAVKDKVVNQDGSIREAD